MTDNKLIREQIDYYHRRAAEYDVTSTPAGDALERQVFTSNR